MTARAVLTYVAAFMTGAGMWIAIQLVKVVNPFLPWEYPALIPFIGMTFPGGAPLEIHLLNHAAETWGPFLTAYGAAYALTAGQVRFCGAVVTYIAFLLWSGVLVLFASAGVPVGTLFYVGAAGTLLGGLVLYQRVITPHLPHPPRLG